MAESCPVCGGAVEVRAAREGTNYYVPVARGRVGDAELAKSQRQLQQAQGERDEWKAEAEAVYETVASLSAVAQERDAAIEQVETQRQNLSYAAQYGALWRGRAEAQDEVHR